MAELKCPHCGEVFEVDENSYEKLLKEVKDNAFNDELHKKLESALKQKELEDKINYDKAISEKMDEIHKLESEINKAKQDITLANNIKEQAINELKASQESVLTKTNYEHNERVQKLEAEYQAKLDKLQNIIDNNTKDKELAISKQQELSNKEKQELVLENQKLEAKLLLKDSENLNAIQKVETQYQAEIQKKENELNSYKIQQTEKYNDLVKNHEEEKKQLNDQINYFKDLKTKMSTKLVGETLEQHCLIEFNKIRGLLPSVYFEKDNDAKTGSKGDFIYREMNGDVEVLSIMFEMKNEMDTTEKKHKNEDFFKELDKDRKEKNCEYAVLVSMLEADNDLYNSGITNVYQYEKMYVVRPQCFTAIISLLRDLALKTVNAKLQLAEAKRENADLSQFEQNLKDFKDSFNKNYEVASKHFENTISEIDKAIKALEKTKAELLGVNKQLGYANNKAQEITVRRLTNGAPSVRETLDEIRKNNE